MRIRSNLSLVQKAVKNWDEDIDVRTRQARDEMMNALIQLTAQQIKGRRPYTIGPRGGKRYQKATPNEPPMNRTGDLRRSIIGEKYTLGFARYSAVVGPTVPYARRLELGGGNWPAGLRFPYMEPAYAEFMSQILPQIQQKYFRRYK